MARYHVINTGGTIGMAAGPNGLTPDADLVARTLVSDPALTDGCNPPSAPLTH
jgi:L-asparaginase